jgi:hypothetical protein
MQGITSCHGYLPSRTLAEMLLAENTVTYTGMPLAEI